MNWLKGKKSYIVAVLTGLVSVYSGFAAANPGQFPPIPEYVWGILGALGLGAIRASIPKEK